LAEFLGMMSSAPPAAGAEPGRGGLPDGVEAEVAQEMAEDDARDAAEAAVLAQEPSAGGAPSGTEHGRDQEEAEPDETDASAGEAPGPAPMTEALS
jgi:hypothetical protein